MRQKLIIPDFEQMEESIELAEAYDCGFEYNDFFDPLILDNRKIVRDSIGFIKKYREDRSRDTLHGAFLDVTVHSSDPKIREISRKRVEQSLEIAEELGVKGVVFHTGLIGGFRLDYYINQWKEMNEECFRYFCHRYPGIEIYMENMFDDQPDVLTEFAETMSDVKNFGVCLDYGHAIVMGTDIEAWVKKLSPYIRHMHVNDNDLHNDLHMEIGAGKIDWNEYQKLMEKYHISADILIEVRGIEEQRKSISFLKEKELYPYEK